MKQEVVTVQQTPSYSMLMAGRESVMKDKNKLQQHKIVAATTNIVNDSSNNFGS